MRLDLEIQPSSISLMFVEGGMEIPNSSIPIFYTNVKETNLFPSDFTEIEFESGIRSYMEAQVTEHTGTSIVLPTNKVLVTNVIGFSKLSGTRYPIFFKHKIAHSLNKKIIDQSVKVIDEIGTEVDKDLFIVVSSGAETFIYLNPVENSLLFIEYSDDEKIYREMAKLTPVFEDVSYKFTAPYTLAEYEYKISQTGSTYTLETPTTGTKFISYDKSYSFVQKPIGDLKKDWFLRIKSIYFESIGASGETIKHFPVEYNIHKMINPDDFLKYNEQQCLILNSNFVKTQTPPNKLKLNEVDILIKNIISEETVFAFTTNSTLVGTNAGLSGVIYNAIDDYNYDGIFKLPIAIDKDTYKAFATFSVRNDFFEYKALNLNAISSSNSKLIALYITEYNPVNDSETNSIYYAFLGKDDARTNPEKYKKNGAGFDTVSNYEGFLAQTSSVHICYVSVAIDKMHKILDIIECKVDKQEIVNQYEIAKETTDIFKNDIRNNNIHMHLNDTVYVNLNQDILNGTEEDNKEYVSFLKNVIEKNINASASIVIGDGNV